MGFRTSVSSLADAIEAATAAAAASPIMTLSDTASLCFEAGEAVGGAMKGAGSAVVDI
jgi:hypothetical protein